MSEEEFFTWLKSRGVSHKDCITLSSKFSLNAYATVVIMVMGLSSASGVTPSGFTQLDAEDFDDLGLTKIGKKLVLKCLAEIKV